MNAPRQVRLNVYATLRQYVEGRASIEAQVEAGTDIATLLESSGIPAAKARIVFVNHRAAQLSDPLFGGEVVGVFPAVGGG